MAAVQYYGTGRRKTSAARVFLRPGTGAISINHRAFDQFFPTEALRTQIRRPLVLTETAEKARMEKELETAGTVQETLFPEPKFKSGPLQIVGWLRNRLMMPAAATAPAPM